MQNGKRFYRIWKVLPENKLGNAILLIALLILPLPLGAQEGPKLQKYDFQIKQFFKTQYNLQTRQIPVTLYSGVSKYNFYQPFKVVRPEKADYEIRKLLRSQKIEIPELGIISQNCQDASGAWQRSLDSVNVNVDPLNTLKGRIETRVKLNLLKYSKEYEKYCLKPGRPSEDKEAKLLANGFGSVAAFVVLGNKPICSALRVQENIVLTAKHCFYDVTTGTAKTNVPISRARIFLYDDKSQGVKIVKELVNYSGVGAASDSHIYADYVYFETEPFSVPMVEKEITWRSPKSVETIILAGYFRFHDLDIRFDNDPKTQADLDWRRGVRLQGGGMCRVIELNADGCIAHYCQTDEGFSGAPIFSLDDMDKNLVFLGLHVGSMGRGSECKFSQAAKAGNIAIAVKQ